MGLNLNQPRVVLVTRQTRMEGLLRAFGTRGQARFRYKGNKVAAYQQAGQIEDAMLAQSADEDEDFDLLEDEDSTYREAIAWLNRELELGMPVQVIDRRLVPHLDFTNCTAIVVAGPDGLVANTAKYVTNVPIIGVNPDPQRIDGVLLPFGLEQARDVVSRVLNQRAVIRPVTLAEAVLHDGQRMLAFNDLFIGARSHTSARYELNVDGDSEVQSSSGVLVSTGAGSTGWMSSVYNMSLGVTQWIESQYSVTPPPPLDWESPSLRWAVREPFRSQTTGARLVAGEIWPNSQLRLESHMSGEGVIFSDGMESDFMRFDGGDIVTIQAAQESAQLVVARPTTQ